MQSWQNMSSWMSLIPQIWWYFLLFSSALSLKKYWSHHLAIEMWKSSGHIKKLCSSVFAWMTLSTFVLNLIAGLIKLCMNFGLLSTSSALPLTPISQSIPPSSWGAPPAVINKHLPASSHAGEQLACWVAEPHLSPHSPHHPPALGLSSLHALW